MENRLTARINAPYRVRFRAPSGDGRLFEEHTVLDNLSGGGLYLRLARPVSAGTEVSLAIRLSTVDAPDSPSLHLAARGTVLRVEPQADCSYGVAVAFKRRRIL